MYRNVIILPSVIFLVISLLYLVFAIPKTLEKFDNEYVINLSILTLVNVVVFFITIRRYYSSWISFDLFFILGFLIVHYQIPFLESIGIPNPQPGKVWINKFVVNYAIWLSTMFLFLWMLGYYLFLGFRSKIYLTKHSTPISPIKKKKSFDVLMIISFLVFYALVGSEFWKGNHAGSDNWGAGATYAYIFVRTFLFLSIIYLFYSNQNRLQNREDYVKFYIKNKLVLNLTFIYFLGFLLIGDRGPIMQVILLYLAGYTIFVKRIKFIKILGLIIFGSFVLTIIGMGRTRDTSTRDGNIISSGIENFNDKEDVNPTNELATSVRILYRALDVVPEKHPYLNGITLISNIVDIIPLSGSITPVPKIYQNTTHFFTFLGQGINPTFGEGSEIIADLYVNIGIIPTLLVAVIFGYFISYMTYKQQNNPNEIQLIIYLGLLILALYLNRSNFLMPLKIIVYMLVFNKIFVTKVKRKIE